MLRRLFSTAGGAAIAALLAPVAAADPCGGEHEPACPGYAPVLNEQIQLGDVWSSMEVVTPDRVTEAVGTSAAYGNVTSNLRENGQIDFRSTQTMDGETGAYTYIETGPVDGVVIGTTTAYANSVLAGSWNGDVNYTGEQTANGDVSARTVTRVQQANDLAIATTGAANVSAAEGENGTIRNFVEHDANGSVYAGSDVVNCCQGNSGQVVTTALGNSTAVTGSGTTSYAGAVQTTAADETISAVTSYYSPNANGTTIGAATASGNSATVVNDWGLATLGREGSELFQGNLSAVSANSVVTLDSWSGITSSSAYGVGNSALISNIGFESGLYGIQSNYGDVSTGAQLIGNSTSGGTGLVTSTAIGNAASAYVCSTCGTAPITGSIQQFNAGSVTAYGRAYTPAAGGIIGSAVAVGNTSTYTSTSGKGH